MFSPLVSSTEEAMRRLFDTLGERERRLYAAAEALNLGRGGLVYPARLFECDPKTIRRRIHELQQEPSLPPGRSRKKGGKPCLTLLTGLNAAFLQIVRSHTAGDPMREGVL